MSFLAFGLTDDDLEAYPTGDELAEGYDRP